jgi:hypothetical protein
MANGRLNTDHPENLAERVAEVVLAHPSVVRLDGGALDLVATHLPGRKVVGVRVVENEPVEISVVLVLGSRVPQVSSELRTAVRSLTGKKSVDITITDLVEPVEENKSITASHGERKPR